MDKYNLYIRTKSIYNYQFVFNAHSIKKHIYGSYSHRTMPYLMTTKL